MIHRYAPISVFSIAGSALNSNNSSRVFGTPRTITIKIQKVFSHDGFCFFVFRLTGPDEFALTEEF